MLMFNEKVKVIPTGHDLNFLTVETFQEVFFDVFEITINKNTFIAEKVSEYKGMPVVIIPITYLNKKYDASFVLKEGAFEVLFNPKTLTYTGEVPAESVVVEEIIQDIIECKDTSIDDFIIEKRDDIINDINQAKLSATKYAEAIKQQKISEASLDIEAKQVRIKNEIAELKQDLLNEFYSLTENVRSDLNESNSIERNNVLDFINNSLTKLSDKLISDVTSHRADAIELFDEKIEQLANNILKVNLLKEIEHNQVSNLQSIDEKFKAVTEVLNTFILKEQAQVVDTVTNIVNTKLEEYDASLITLEKVNVEINESIKTLNIAFNESNNALDTLISNRIDVATSNIHDFYDNKIQLIEANVTDITASQKQEFISLINESKQSLLAQIAEIKIQPNPILIEQKGSKPIDLKDVKKDLEKEITNKFTSELVNLKRYIELSSGGGSVAQQFANGGTMNGNLIVTGTLSASQYLGITQGGGGVSGDYLPLSGGTVNGNLTVVGTLCATLLEALSANITVLDIKQYELSGFNVTGNATVQGTISASGNLITASSVGIGTNTPSTKLEVVGSIGKFNVSDEGYTTSMTRSNSNLGLYAGYNLGIISFGGTADGYTTQQVGAQINSQTEGTGAGSWQLRPAANLLFYTTPNLSGAVLTERMRITGAGNVGIGTSTPSAKLDVVDTTLAGSGGLSGSVLNLTQTWATSSSPTAIKLNVTDTSSNAASLLMDLRVGARSSYAFGKTTLTLPPSAGSGIVWPGVSVQNVPCSITRAADDTLAVTAGLGSGKNISIGGNGYGLTLYNYQIKLNTFLKDVYLSNDDNHILALRAAANPQALRLYNTYTNDTTFERLNLQWQTNVFKFGTEKGSAGGLARSMEFQTDGTTRMNITTAGDIGVRTTTPGNLLHIDCTLNKGILLTNSTQAPGRANYYINAGQPGAYNAFNIMESYDGILYGHFQAYARSIYLGGFANAVSTASVTVLNDQNKLDLLQLRQGLIGSSTVFRVASSGNTTIYGTVSAIRYLGLQDSLSGNPVLIGGNSTGTDLLIGTNDNYALNLETAGSTKMTVTSAGTVGIGTTTPLAILDVSSNGDTSLAQIAVGKINHAGGIRLRRGSDGAATGYIGYGNLTDFGYGFGINSGGGGGHINLTAAGGPVTIYAGNVNPSIFAGNGSVGINTLTPVAKLDVVDTTLAGSGGLSGSVLKLTQTWNTSGAPTAITLNVTNSASGAASKLMDLQVDGVSKFIVEKPGGIRINDGSVTFGSDQKYITFNTAWGEVNFKNWGGELSISGAALATFSVYSPAYFTTHIGLGGNKDTADVKLWKDSTSILAQRNGLLSQTSRLYNTYTDASNYRRGIFSFSSAASAFIIGTETSTTAGVSALSALVNPIIIAPGYNQSLSATAPVILQQTWNNASNAFTLLSANVTDTASSTSSLLMDLQIGGSTKFLVQKTGRLFIGGFSGSSIENSGGVCLINSSGQASAVGGPLFFTSAYDTLLTRDGAAGTLAQRNGINPQAFRLYNTFTDTVSTFERLNIKWDTDVLKIGTEKGSIGGVARDLVLETNATERVRLTSDIVKITAGAYTPWTFYGSAGVPILENSGSAYIKANGNLLLGSTNITAFRSGPGLSLTWSIDVNGHFREYGSGSGSLDIGTAANLVRSIYTTNLYLMGGSLGLGTTAPTEKLDVVGNAKVSGHFSAATKSFLIPHPTKPTKQLQYACLEGPENGVYIRGKTNESVIILPDYWQELVDEDSVTVTVTPIGKFQQLFVASQTSESVEIGNVDGFYNYVIYGERKDVDKLQTEI